MKPQRDHYIKLSFQLWLDHYLMEVGECFNTGEFKLYRIDDNYLPSGFYSLSSPVKQWIWDSSINNVIIPTEITINGTAHLIDDSGIIADFDNGRILINEAPNTDEIYAKFSYKDFNIYATNQTEEELLTANNFKENSRFYIKESGIEPYSPVIPAIFFNFSQSENNPFTLGGEDNVKYKINAVVITENEYQLDGVLNLLRDTARRNFPLISGITRVDTTGSDGNFIGATYPFGPFWNTTQSGFNYQKRVTEEMEGHYLDFIYIEKVQISKFSDKIRENLNLSSYAGLVDVYLSDIRCPRI